jgi:hypothetical protein
MTARPTLTQTLNALEVVTDKTITGLRAGGHATTALAYVAIRDNAITTTLELAAAIRAALAGDLEPARTAMRDLRLDQVEIR